MIRITGERGIYEVKETCDYRGISYVYEGNIQQIKDSSSAYQTAVPERIYFKKPNPQRGKAGNYIILNEAVILDKLKNISGFPQIRDSGWFTFDDGDSTLGIVTEEVGGKSLTELLEEGPLKPGLAINIFEQLINLLTYCHDKEIIHFDISEDNLKIERGKITLLDFGFGRKKDTEIRLLYNQCPQEDMIIEKESKYMVKEGVVCRKKGALPEADLVTARPATDIYLAGNLLYFMLTKREEIELESLDDILMDKGTKEILKGLVGDMRVDIGERINAEEIRKRLALCSPIKQYLDLEENYGKLLAKDRNSLSIDDLITDIQTINQNKEKLEELRNSMIP